MNWNEPVLEIAQWVMIVLIFLIGFVNSLRLDKHLDALRKQNKVLIDLVGDVAEQNLTLHTLINRQEWGE